MQFTARYDRAAARLELAGECHMDDAPALARALRELRDARPSTLLVALADAQLRDIGPAWLLHRSIDGLREAGVAVDLDGPTPGHFAYFDELLARDAGEWEPAHAPTLADRLADAGRRLEARVASWYESLVFGGRLIEAAAVAWRSIKRLRVPSVVRHMHETGVQAVPVVAVIALLISVISAYIGAQQLRPFGAEIFTVDLVAIGVLRELGRLTTVSVVQSIFLVIFADALFAIFFLEIDF
jgi:phospholipid/cholesterol/gamma-HCH transport system permease protein